MTTAEPGAGGRLMLVVDDIAAARDELISRGIEVSDVFHAEGGGYGAGFHPGTEGRAPGRTRTAARTPRSPRSAIPMATPG